MTANTARGLRSCDRGRCSRQPRTVFRPQPPQHAWRVPLHTRRVAGKRHCKIKTTVEYQSASNVKCTRTRARTRTHARAQCGAYINYLVARRKAKFKSHCCCVVQKERGEHDVGSRCNECGGCEVGAPLRRCDVYLCILEVLGSTPAAANPRRWCRRVARCMAGECASRAIAELAMLRGCIAVVPRPPHPAGRLRSAAPTYAFNGTVVVCESLACTAK